MIQYTKDGLPVIQEFPPEFAGFFMTGSRHLVTKRFQAIQFLLKLGFDTTARAFPGCIDAIHQGGHDVEYLDAITLNPGCKRIGQSLCLADQMRPAAYPFFVISVYAVAIGHQPAGIQKADCVPDLSSVSLPRDRFWDVPVNQNRLANATAIVAPAALRPCRSATPSQARCWLRSTPANGSTACRMRLHTVSAGYGTCGPFATPTLRPRLRLPGTTRLRFALHGAQRV